MLIYHINVGAVRFTPVKGGILFLTKIGTRPFPVYFNPIDFYYLSRVIFLMSESNNPFPNLPDLGESIAEAFSAAGDFLIKDLIKSGLNYAGGAIEVIIRIVIEVILLPPQPYTSAQHLNGVNVHGNGPAGTLDLSKYGCGAANPGSDYNSIWESMYCLNDTFTEIALMIFGGAFVLYLIGLGIGWIDIQNMTESLWTATLTFIFIIANEEILGLGWAAVYAISDAIIQADLRSGVGGHNTLVESIVYIFTGILGAGSAGAAASGLGVTALGGFSMATGGWIVLGALLGVLLLLVLVFMLIMFFVQLIALIGYGVFPLLALLIGFGEMFDKLSGPTKKITGLFIPAMYSPILFAVVFKVSVAFIAVGGFGDNSSLSDFLFMPLMGVGALFVGTWMMLKQFKAGQIAVGAATSVLTTAAAGAVVGMTSASAGSALKGAAYGGPKGALANAAGDAVGGSGSDPLDPQEKQDEIDDEEEFEDDEEEFEDERGLEEFGDEAEPEEEESLLDKAKSANKEWGTEGEAKTITGAAKDKASSLRDGLQDRFGGDEDEELADVEQADYTQSVYGEDGTGHSTGKKNGKRGFEEDKEEVMEQIEDGDIDAYDAIDGVAAHRADMLGKKGQEKKDFIEESKSAFTDLVNEKNHPGISKEEARAEAFDDYTDSMHESMQASVGNSGVLYGNDFDQKYAVNRNDALRDLKNEESRMALAADPTSGIGQDEIENHDAGEVLLTDSEYGGEAAEDRGMHARSMEKANQEEEIVEEIGEARAFKDGTVGVGINEQADADQISDVVDDEIMERAVQDDETGLYKMSPEDARKATSQITSNATQHSGQGINAKREASILMDESGRRNMRNEAMIQSRRSADNLQYGGLGYEMVAAENAEDGGTKEDEILHDTPDAGITDTGINGDIRGDKVRITGETNKGGTKASKLNYRATTDVDDDEFGSGDAVAEYDEETGETTLSFDSNATGAQVKQLAEENLSDQKEKEIKESMSPGPDGQTLQGIGEELQYEVVQMMAEDGMVVDADRNASISFTEGATGTTASSRSTRSTTIRGWESELESGVGGTPTDPSQEVSGTTATMSEGIDAVEGTTNSHVRGRMTQPETTSTKPDEDTTLSASTATPSSTEDLADPDNLGEAANAQVITEYTDAAKRVNTNPVSTQPKSGQQYLDTYQAMTVQSNASYGAPIPQTQAATPTQRSIRPSRNKQNADFELDVSSGYAASAQEIEQQLRIAQSGDHVEPTEQQTGWRHFQGDGGWDSHGNIPKKEARRRMDTTVPEEVPDTKGKKIAKITAASMGDGTILKNAGTTTKAVQNVIDDQYSKLAAPNTSVDEITESIIASDPSIGEEQKEEIKGTVEIAQVMTSKARQEIGTKETTTPSNTTSDEHHTETVETSDLSFGEAIAEQADVVKTSQLQVEGEQPDGFNKLSDLSITVDAQTIQETARKNKQTIVQKENVNADDIEPESDSFNEIVNEIKTQVDFGNLSDSEAQNLAETEAKQAISETVANASQELDIEEHVDIDVNYTESQNTGGGKNSRNTGGASAPSGSPSSNNSNITLSNLVESNKNTITVNEQQAEQAAANIANNTDLSELERQNSDKPIYNELGIKDSPNNNQEYSAVQAIRNKLREQSDNLGEIPYSGRNSPSSNDWEYTSSSTASGGSSKNKSRTENLTTNEIAEGALSESSDIPDPEEDLGDITVDIPSGAQYRYIEDPNQHDDMQSKGAWVLDKQNTDTDTVSSDDTPEIIPTVSWDDNKIDSDDPDGSWGEDMEELIKDGKTPVLTGDELNDIRVSKYSLDSNFSHESLSSRHPELVRAIEDEYGEEYIELRPREDTDVDVTSLDDINDNNSGNGSRN